MAGRLALDEEMSETRKSVFINYQGSVQFNVYAMSTPPEIIGDVRHFTCWETRLSAKSDFREDLFADDDERIQDLKTYLQDKVIFFTPVQKIDSDRNERLYSANLIGVAPAPDALSHHSRLVPILYLKDMEPAEFEKRLNARHPVGGLYQRTVPKETPAPNPILVWVKDVLYGPFETMRWAHGGWVFRGEEVRKLRTKLSEYGTLVLPFQHVIFIEEETYYQDIVRRVCEQGVIVQPGEGGGASAEIASTRDVGTPLTVGLATATGASIAEASNGAEVVAPFQVSHQSSTDSQDVSEPQFLERLKQLAQEKRLFYNEEDLVNFHTAVKTGSLVLLSGMSGTGKSRLVQLYAEALGMSDDQYALISVRPTWTDDSDLLGFFDLTHSIYRAADSGLIDLLLRAQAHPDQLYLVCFDEMNLARVEHYFSQFISVLELEPHLRYIRLYSDHMQAQTYNSSIYPPRIPVGQNIIFIGTVNVDESTYAFSDKVLDRAHVIRLRVEPFSEVWSHYEKGDEPVERSPVMVAQYDRWRNLEAEISLSQEELRFLEEVHNAFQGVDLQLGLGHRTVRQIDGYLRNIPIDVDGSHTIERSIAFDLQMVQKVLTKLRGPEDHLEGLVGQVDPTGEVEGSALIEIMDQYEHLSSFTVSRQVIRQKAKELKVYGYAS